MPEKEDGLCTVGIAYSFNSLTNSVVSGILTCVKSNRLARILTTYGLDRDISIDFIINDPVAQSSGMYVLGTHELVYNAKTWYKVEKNSTFLTDSKFYIKRLLAVYLQTTNEYATTELSILL